MPSKQHVLEFIGSTVELAEEDLKAGDVDRVQHHLQTIRFLLGDSPASTTSRKIKNNGNSGGGGRPRSELGKAVEAAVLAMLQDGPKSISEIREGLEERGVAVPGAGRAANLIAHLRRMKNVERAERGVYRLTA